MLYKCSPFSSETFNCNKLWDFISNRTSPQLQAMDSIQFTDDGLDLVMFSTVYKTPFSSPVDYLKPISGLHRIHQVMEIFPITEEAWIWERSAEFRQHFTQAVYGMMPAVEVVFELVYK